MNRSSSRRQPRPAFLSPPDQAASGGDDGSGSERSRSSGRSPTAMSPRHSDNFPEPSTPLSVQGDIAEITRQRDLLIEQLKKQQDDHAQESRLYQDRISKLTDELDEYKERLAPVERVQNALVSLSVPRPPSESDRSWRAGIWK